MIHAVSLSTLFTTGMGRQTLLSGFLAAAIPCLVWLISSGLRKRRREFQWLTLALYVGLILRFTLTGRFSAVREINLHLFWSYGRFRQADIRWQIYMNVFLFIPFGFLLPMSLTGNFRQTLLTGLGLSVLIELAQLCFGIGLCELDDVFHNTLGTVIGYGYWRGLTRLREHRGIRLGPAVTGAWKRLCWMARSFCLWVQWQRKNHQKGSKGNDVRK